MKTETRFLAAAFLATFVALTGSTAGTQEKPAPAPNSGTSGKSTARLASTAEEFKRLDVDHDGRISLNEFVAPATAEKKAESAKAKATDAKSESGDAGVLTSTSTVQGRYSPEVFKQLDINHDAFLSAAELDALTGSAHPISQP